MASGAIITAFTSLLLALLQVDATGVGDRPPLETARPIGATLKAGSVKGAGSGFAPSDNLPRVLDRAAPPDRLSLIALPEEDVSYRKHRGFTVLLVNTTSEEVAVAAIDSTLPIIREARDREGRWRPIEFEARVSCGNSYHTVYLPPGHYWSMPAPVYSGTFPTTMRFVLTVRGGGKLYSNAFMGFIQPGQFELPPSPR